MADEGTGEKTEEPTPQKLRKAREKGQVGKSRDAASALVFAGTFAVLYVSISYIGNELSGFLVEALESATSLGVKTSVTKVLGKGLNIWLLVSIPVLGAAMVLGLIGNYMQVGFLFTMEPIKPELKKINPFKGLKQLFSVKRLVEVIKQMVKFILVAVVVYSVLDSALRNIVMTQRTDLLISVSVASTIIKDIIIRVAVLFMLIAVADFFWQRRVFKKSMMMSKYDIKQEYKQSEGDPELKGERKRLARDLVLNASQQNTKNADAVVTNPVHIAVAIKYDANRSSAPVIVSKGMRKNAEIIKSIARENEVPIIRNVPLAQALNKLDIDEEISEELYEAVAEILNFVYELKAKETAN